MYPQRCIELTLGSFHAVHAHGVEAQHGVELSSVAKQQRRITVKKPTQVAKFLKVVLFWLLRHQMRGSSDRINANICSDEKFEI